MSDKERSSGRVYLQFGHFYYPYCYPSNKKGLPKESNLLIIMARPERFELPTAWFVAIYSQSNYLFLLYIVQSARCHFIST